MIVKYSFHHRIYQPLTLTSSYENVEMSLFYPYKDNAKIYFEDLDQKCVDSNINNIAINCYLRFLNFLNERF
jgi:hypothetical protein